MHGLTEGLARHFYPLVDPFIHYFGPALGMLVAAALVTLFIDIVYELVIGREELERVRKMADETKKYQEELQRAKVLGDVKRMKEIEEKMRDHSREFLKVQSQLMSKQIKAMIITFPPIIIIIYTLEYRLAHWTVKLPFYVPGVGDTLGPVGWYILCAVTVSFVLKPLAETAVKRFGGG